MGEGNFVVFNRNTKKLSWKIKERGLKRLKAITPHPTIDTISIFPWTKKKVKKSTKNMVKHRGN